mgnify:CR=1 FL=1
MSFHFKDDGEFVGFVETALRPVANLLWGFCSWGVKTVLNKIHNPILNGAPMPGHQSPACIACDRLPTSSSLGLQRLLLSKRLQ